MFIIDIIDYVVVWCFFFEFCVVYVECFLNDVLNDECVLNDGEIEDVFFDCVIWFYEECEIMWFVLCEFDVCGCCGVIVGFACGCVYADSWYGAYLGVVSRR